MCLPMCRTVTHINIQRLANAVDYTYDSQVCEFVEFVTVHGAPIRRMGLVPANQQALG